MSLDDGQRIKTTTEYLTVGEAPAFLEYAIRRSGGKHGVAKVEHPGPASNVPWVEAPPGPSLHRLTGSDLSAHPWEGSRCKLCQTC